MFDKSKVKYIVFDMDGTLINSMPSLTKVYARMNLEKFGISEEISNAHLMETLGTHMLEMVADLCTRHKIDHVDHQQFLIEFRKRINEFDQEPFEDVIPALETLSKKYTLIVSSAPSEDFIEDKLQKLGIRKYFSLILGHAADGSYSKGPQHIEQLMKRKNLTKEDLTHAIYIGDGRKDMQIAKVGNMLAVGRTGTFSAERLKEFGADIVVNDLNEFAEWLMSNDC